MDIAALIVAIITLIFALFIHSEVRDTLSRLNAIMDTSRGAYDVNRVIKDIEKNKARRGTVICTEPKNTYVSWKPLSPQKLNLKDRFWMWIRTIASWFSGDTYQSVVEDENIEKKWEVTAENIIFGNMDELLRKGWEPFSVTDNRRMWFRKGAIVKTNKK